MAKVFITGIAGFLGSHVADRLLALGHQVSGNDSLIGGYRDNVPKDARYFDTDCCDLEGMSRAMNDAEVVIHTAAMAYEGLSVFSPATITQSIVQASVTTFTAAIINDVRRVVYCSSMARYGDNPIPFREDMPTRARDPYGVGKVAGEEMLKTLAEAHGMEWVIAIPHNIIGARQKYDDPYRNVASIMANLMLQGRQPYIYGDGTQMRCFSPVQDVVDCLVQLTLEEGMSRCTVNVGPDDGFITIRDLAERIAVLTDFEGLEPVHVPARPAEVRLAHCSADLARELLGYESRRSLNEGLADVVAYIRTRGVRPFAYHLPIEIRNARTPKTWTDQLF